MEKIVIEGFMLDRLKLNSNALVLYAILWCDSKRGKDKVQNDFARYSGMMNVAIPTYYSALRKLTERGLVSEAERGMITVTDKEVERSPFKRKKN